MDDSDSDGDRGESDPQLSKYTRQPIIAFQYIGSALILLLLIISPVFNLGNTL